MDIDLAKWILRGLVAFLLATIVYLGWDTAQSFARRDGGRLETPPQTTAPTPQAAARPGLANRSAYQSIVRRNVFGTVRNQPQNPLGIDVEALEKTDLDVKLWGTVFDATDTAYAVIETRKDEGQALYRVGEYIQNARIRLILRNRVVLSVEGRDEVLDLHESLQSAGLPPDRSPPQRSGPDPSQLIAVDPELLAALLSAPENLNQHARLEAADPANGQTGVQLAEIESGSIFGKLGLVPGDVIESAEGVPVSAPEDVAGLLEDLTAVGEATVSVQRAGKPLSIRYVLRDPDMYPGQN